MNRGARTAVDLKSFFCKRHVLHLSNHFADGGFSGYWTTAAVGSLLSNK
jgi:hypothetical protein